MNPETWRLGRYPGSLLAVSGPFAYKCRSMNELSFYQWGVLALAALIVGLAKSGIPGLGILAVPMVAAVIPAKLSTGFILPLLIAGDIIGVVYYRRHADWPHLLRLFPWAAAGVLIGWLSMGHLNDTEISPIIGGIVLAMLALHFWRQRFTDPDSRPPPTYPWL